MEILYFVSECGIISIAQTDKSQSVYAAYREQAADWEKLYGTDRHKKDKESIHERLKNSPKRTAEYQQQQIRKGKDRGAR